MSAQPHHWFSSTNHRTVGKMYLGASLGFGAAATSASLLMRAQLAVPNNTVLSSSAYLQAYVFHGFVFWILFALPFLLGLAIYLVPIHVGAGELVYPGINAAGFWLYAAGGVVASAGLLLNNGIGGWVNFPLSTNQINPWPGPDLLFAGIVAMAISVAITSSSLLITFAFRRAPTVSLGQVPTFTLSVALSAIPMVALPLVLLIQTPTPVSVVGINGVAFWDYFLFLFNRWGVFILLVPVFAIVADVLSESSGSSHYWKLIVFSWPLVFLNVPFSWLLFTLAFFIKLARSSIHLSAPVLFSVGAVSTFVAGEFLSLFLQLPVLDRVLRGTDFVVAEYHYWAVGTIVFGAMAGFYHFLPKVSERMYDRKIADWHFLLTLIGFNVTFLPLVFLTDMPQVTSQAIPDWANLNLIATMGAVILAVAQMFLVLNITQTLRGGRASPAP